eukprot:951568-Rhodomonas_salina.1
MQFVPGKQCSLYQECAVFALSVARAGHHEHAPSALLARTTRCGPRASNVPAKSKPDTHTRSTLCTGNAVDLAGHAYPGSLSSGWTSIRRNA